MLLLCKYQSAFSSWFSKTSSEGPSLFIYVMFESFFTGGLTFLSSCWEMFHALRYISQRGSMYFPLSDMGNHLLQGCWCCWGTELRSLQPPTSSLNTVWRRSRFIWSHQVMSANINHHGWPNSKECKGSIGEKGGFQPGIVVNNGYICMIWKVFG